MQHICSLKTLSESLENLAPFGLKLDPDLTLPHNGLCAPFKFQVHPNWRNVEPTAGPDIHS